MSILNKCIIPKPTMFDGKESTFLYCEKLFNWNINECYLEAVLKLNRYLN